MKKARMWWAIAAVMLAMLGIAAQSVLAVPMPDPRLAVSLKDLPAVSSQPIPEALRIGRTSRVLLSLGDDGVWRAFSDRSTHHGDPVFWSEQYDRWLDVRLGSGWDRNGRPIAGPAPRGLDWYSVSVDGDLLVVDLSRLHFGR